MEKICGNCSQEQKMTLEERIGISLSRFPKQVYKCPICKNDHFFNGKPKKEVRLEPKRTTDETFTGQLELVF